MRPIRPDARSARILLALLRPVVPHFMGGQGRACGLHPAQTFSFPLDWSRCAGRGLGAPPSALTFAHPERALNRAEPAITRHHIENGKRGSRERSIAAAPICPGGRCSSVTRLRSLLPSGVNRIGHCTQVEPICGPTIAATRFWQQGWMPSPLVSPHH
jgi:hypothetical protein